MILWQFVFAVAIWWIANTLTSVVSKNVMYDDSETYEGVTGWTTAFKDLRWLDLTVLQHLIGMVASAAWLKVVMKQPLLPEEMPRTAIYMAAVGNVIGNLATNAAYALISSSTTQVIKACEPIFTFGFSILLLSNRESLNLPTLLSIVTMIIGACIVTMLDASFNIWGLIAAVCSNIAFPLRNIYLKKLNNPSTGPLQKFAIVSTYSTLLLLPAITIKLANAKKVFHVSRREVFASSLTHVAYNVASIGVLQNVIPLSHAILNLSKRVFVIFVNIAYFQTSFSVSMSIGILVFFVGLTCYYRAISGGNNSKTSSIRMLFLLGLLVIAACICGQYFNSRTLSGNQPQKSRLTRLVSEKRIFSAWVFERPLPLSVVNNVRAIGQQYPTIPIHVYCGTTQCVNVVSKLNSLEARFTVEFLVISDIVQDTPLEQWIARHPLNKVLSGSEFENHLQIAVQLGILWRYGGVYVDPTVKVVEDLLPEMGGNAWITRGVDGRESLDFSYFPAHHHFINNLMERFIREYSKRALMFDFSTITRDAYSSCVTYRNCPACATLLHTRSLVDENVSEGRHYGTLSYNSRVNEVNNANLGDEIQGFPGLQFLPFIDHFVERDALNTSASNQKIKIFFNAWWGSRQSDWPPPDNIEPIMISVHIHTSVQEEWAQHMDYFKSKAPIGCRDYSTLDYFTKHGVEAYFSGCLTLLLKDPGIKGIERTNITYLVDVKEEYIEMLPLYIQEQAIIIHHDMSGRGRKSSVERFSAGYRLIERYASAKLVITQRIHSALPCVAMGTPVVFINSPKLPGGGGTEKESSERITGLLQLFHTVDMYVLSTEEAMLWLTSFPWDNPPPNPNVDLMMRLRATAWNVIRQDRALYDTAHKFGLIPMAPPPAKPEEADQLLFHLILPTSSKTMKWFNHSCGTCNLEEVVSWRSIESIFHHHPFSKVIVHSNTVLQSDFAVLTEAGYSIEVNRYDFWKLLQDSPAQSFVNQVRSSQQDHLERDILWAVILYNQGGIYMNIDVILVHHVDSLAANVMVWKDLGNTTISKSFMKFQKGSVFLKSYLQAFDVMYQNKSMELLTKLLGSKIEDNDIHILHYPAVSVLNSDIRQTVFGNFHNQQAVYGVQLCSSITRGFYFEKLKEESIYKHPLNLYCVLCNKHY